MIDKDEHPIFLSYATPDRERVLAFYEWLKQVGFNVWIDCRSIKPGQNWDFEIKRALDKYSLVVAFVSHNSFNRRGYVQRELKLALDKLSEKLIDDIYVIPVLLDEGVELPDQLKSIQCIAAADPQCNENIADALTYQLGRLGIAQQKTQRKEDIYWASSTMRESWDGLPGYEVELQLLSFTSDRYANVSQIGEYLRGVFLKSLFTHRADKLAQSPDHFNYGQDKYRRTNTYDAHCSEPSIKGKVLTVQYAVHWYGAGAAHPNYHFETFCFVLEPLTLISSLQSFFVEPNNALAVIQEEVRAQLHAVQLEVTADDEGATLECDWIERGTKEWSDFGAFVFGQDKLDLLFAPYQVATYACGAQFAEIPFARLATLIRPEFRSALGIEHLTQT